MTLFSVQPTPRIDGALSAKAWFRQPSGFVARPRVEFHSMALRATLLIRFLIDAICLLSAAARAGDTQLKKTPFGTGAEVGFGLVKYHNTCVWFRVLFISGDFFKELQQHKTPNGMEPLGRPPRAPLRRAWRRRTASAS